MAVNLNSDLDATQVFLKILEQNYGLELIYALIVIASLVASTYFIAKSGVVAGIRDYSDHRRKKRNEQITEHEKLLEDEFLKEYASELEYHVKVSKLENYLNIKNKDLDLLSLIMSCRDRVKAVKLFKIGKDYLEKDEETNLYKLKPKYTEKKLKSDSLWGTFWYILINIFGASPLILMILLPVLYKEQAPAISSSVFTVVFLFFIAVFIFSLYVLWGFLKPEAAQNFLKLEKINKDKSKRNALDEAA
ncbi:hypothetical protein [Acinetobacter sp. PK01]|uniref:hypothetical protein n=1 Tax=Acinetobacter sp. PK01 TaxID=2930198 RepID=UPI001FB76CB5|nr:hypothetical protein [Acinetobacter sp. PK01]UOG18659.1 hypothetical protein MP622_03345 [Acinetobacter sp. PK01]